MSNNMRKLLKN